jgi:hypothetical protein
MELLFADAGLQHIAESTVRSNAHLGAEDGGLLRQRLCELVAAENLAIAATLPTLDVHPLASHDAGFVVTLRPRLRLVLEVADPIPRVAGNGEIDLGRVAAIRILAIEECDES